MDVGAGGQRTRVSLSCHRWRTWDGCLRRTAAGQRHSKRLQPPAVAGRRGTADSRRSGPSGPGRAAGERMSLFFLFFFSFFFSLLSPPRTKGRFNTKAALVFFILRRTSPYSSPWTEQNQPINFPALAFQFYTHLFSSQTGGDKRDVEEGGAELASVTDCWGPAELGR